MKKYTYSARQFDNPGKWYMVDAEGAVLGRLASSIAARLRGKSNPLFTPHVDTGDWIVVINADKIVLTGKKWDKKNYYRHSGYTGGLKTTSAKELLEKDRRISFVLQSKGCCPRTGLGENFSKIKGLCGRSASSPGPATGSYGVLNKFSTRQFR